MGEKYISFDGWWGGYSNIRMSYEMIAAISVITNRTIILPPKLYCLFLSQHNDKSTFFDMWKTLDIEAFKKQFKCVDYEEVPEYAALEGDIQYFSGIDKIAKIILFDGDYKDWGVQKGIQDNQLIGCNIINNDDYTSFSNGRTLIDLNCDDKFIHFPRNLFGHFYYHIYGNTPTQRNIIKEKIKKGVTYKKTYFEMGDVVKNKIGEYNSIHIRRNDFLQTREYTAKPQLEKLLDDIKDRIDTNIPLYIATDENDKSLFEFLKEHYTIYFLDDFFIDLQNYEKLMVDQIICSKSKIFLGSKFSTFSDYINILRAYSDKLDFHREGTNFKLPKLNYDRFPWEVESYSWDKIWDFCWKYERNYFNLGFFGSHNSAMAISYKGDILEVVELERWVNKKNAAFHYHFPIDNSDDVAKDIYEYFKNKYGAYYYDNVIWNSSKTAHLQFPAKNYEFKLHHYAHVCNAIYQSPSKKSLNISFDGGSDEGTFNIYLGERGKEPEKIFTSSKDLAVCYQTIAHYLSSIKREDNWWLGNLVYAGKLMGLSSYGNNTALLVSKMVEFYEGQDTDSVKTAHERFQKIFGFTNETRLTGNFEKDLARVNQFVFEKTFKKIVEPFIEKYKDRELQFSGGGAMNIINNSIYDAFVSPNPDDRGIALGLVLSKIKTGNIIDSTYLGSEPYDSLPDYFDLNIEEIVTDLINGKIIGIIQGNSEHGARSLGNRSIICMPSIGMKEKLNSEVKHREMFRPFAPVVRLEDAGEFFEFGNHTRWMTHNSIVKEKYKSKIPAITHIDGTARLQTVTKCQNELIYTLLSKLENRGHIPVLLNTSFNIQGNPILNRYADAILIRDTTGLDKVITDKFLLK